MRSYPIYVENISNDNNNFGVKKGEYNKLKIKAGTSKVNSYKFAEIIINNYELNKDEIAYELWLDNVLIKSAVYNRKKDKFKINKNVLKTS